MIASLVLLSVLAVQPVEAFTHAHEGASLLAAPGGERLVHASGFLFAGAGRPEDAAASFLDLHGAAFGVTPRKALLLAGAPAPGTVGAVRFERRIDGLPVFGGDVVVGVDAENRVFLVNGGDVPPAVSGRHAIGEARAGSVALASLAGLRGAGPATVAAGWRTFGEAVRAVYRVDFAAEEPAGDWRVYVDGETGAALFRADLRAYVSRPGTIFQVSPTEDDASACSLASGAHTFCKAPVAVTFQNLVTGDNLAGTQTTVFDCNGNAAPATSAGAPGPCAPVGAASGGFSPSVDSTFRSPSDDFSAAMAYWHLDKHVSFFKALDPTLPSPQVSRALRESLPAFVNAFQGGQPFDNAFFSQILDGMVFGQGATADYAYDATVMYHEFTHGVVFAWGGFDIGVDSLGGLDEPGAVNEGTADSMAVSETGRSEMGTFLGATVTVADGGPLPFIRSMSDPNAKRTCQGDGTPVQQFGATAVNGLDGEVHDDGEIWNGFYWEVFQGLRAAGLRGCGGACNAGPALQYKTLQLAAGNGPTLNSYWQTMKAAASALFPARSGAAAYVDCVAKRRKLDRCDRTVPLYAGESKVEFVRLGFSPFQVVLHATGPSSFRICSANGTTTKVHLRKGAPVQIDPFTGNVLAADNTASFAATCGSPLSLGLISGGDWHLLLDSRAAPGVELYLIQAAATNAGMAARPASAAPATCAPPFLTIAPGSTSVAAAGTVGFSATGGAGAGYLWSLDPSPSGGSIDPVTGAYTAGSAAGVTDVVHLVDASGNTAKANVAVGPPAPPPPPPPEGGGSGGGGGCGCRTSGGAAPVLALVLVALVLRRRPRPGRARRA